MDRMVVESRLCARHRRTAVSLQAQPHIFPSRRVQPAAFPGGDCLGVVRSGCCTSCSSLPIISEINIKLVWAPHEPAFAKTRELEMRRVSGYLSHYSLRFAMTVLQGHPWTVRSVF